MSRYKKAKKECNLLLILNPKTVTLNVTFRYYPGLFFGRVNKKISHTAPTVIIPILNNWAIVKKPKTSGVLRQNSIKKRTIPARIKYAMNSHPGVKFLLRTVHRIKNTRMKDNDSYTIVGWTRSSVGTVPFGNAIAQGKSLGGP